MTRSRFNRIAVIALAGHGLIMARLSAQTMDPGAAAGSGMTVPVATPGASETPAIGPTVPLGAPELQQAAPAPVPATPYVAAAPAGKKRPIAAVAAAARRAGARLAGSRPLKAVVGADGDLSKKAGALESLYMNASAGNSEAGEVLGAASAARPSGLRRGWNRIKAVFSHGARLDAARGKLYELAGGKFGGASVTWSKLTTAQRTLFFQSREFRSWVASEKRAGRQVFLWKDLDKTQARGDIFTFFFKWRADNGKITAEQHEIIKAYLKTLSFKDAGLQEELAKVDKNDVKANAYLVLKLWRGKEDGGEGICLLDFWRDVYWPTQKGLTKKEKNEQVLAFAPHFASRIYPGVPAENKALAEAGVHAVIVSNGDQELARAVAPFLGIPRRNVIGSNLIYKDGIATGVNHAYEIFDKEWASKPQPGKALSIHYWLTANMWRWGWKQLDLEKTVSIGAEGDSASSDGGMMALLALEPKLGNFMADTPREPGRILKFYALAKKYGWNKWQFFTVVPDPSAPGAWTPQDWEDMSQVKPALPAAQSADIGSGGRGLLDYLRDVQPLLAALAGAITGGLIGHGISNALAVYNGWAPSGLNIGIIASLSCLGMIIALLKLG